MFVMSANVMAPIRRMSVLMSVHLPHSRIGYLYEKLYYAPSKRLTDLSDGCKTFYWPGLSLSAKKSVILLVKFSLELPSCKTIAQFTLPNIFQAQKF